MMASLFDIALSVQLQRVKTTESPPSLKPKSRYYRPPQNLYAPAHVSTNSAVATVHLNRTVSTSRGQRWIARQRERASYKKTNRFNTRDLNYARHSKLFEGALPCR